jgi:hypothetical protein
MVAVGKISVTADTVRFMVDRDLKVGSTTLGTLRLVFPEYVPLFEKKSFLQKLADPSLGPCIVLGRPDGAGAAVLTNSIFSVWPLGLNYPSGHVSLEEAKDLVSSVLRYDRAKQAPDALLAELFSDLSRKHVLSVVEYAREEVSRVVPDGGTVRWQILGIAFAEFLASGGNSPEAERQRFFDESDLLPQALALPWLIDLARSSSADAGAALAKINAAFRTRHLVSDHVADLGELQRVFDDQRRALFAYDFQKALAMIDSQYEIVRDASRILLARLLTISDAQAEAELSKKSSPDEIRAYWRDEYARRFGKAAERDLGEPRP